jgi:hypothetical protein
MDVNAEKSRPASKKRVSYFKMLTNAFQKNCENKNFLIEVYIQKG